MILAITYDIFLGNNTRWNKAKIRGIAKGIRYKVKIVIFLKVKTLVKQRN